MQSAVFSIWEKTISNPSPYVIASRIASYPTDEIRKELGELLLIDLVDEKCSDAGEGWRNLKKDLLDLVKSEAAFDKLASDYIDIFDRSSNENSLYETEYGLRRSQLKTGELSDISGFYRAFGFNIMEGKELIDHIAVECEFYALLLAKQQYLLDKQDQEGLEIVLDARKKFLQDHLGRYPMVIAKRPGVISHKYYKAIFDWISKVISKECECLQVDVLPADYFSSAEQDEEISCGSSDDLITQIGKKN